MPRPLPTNKIVGTSGDDLIYGSVEDGKIDGRGGVDTVNFSNSATGVRVELWDGGLGAWPELDPDNPTYQSKVIVNVENVIGSNYDDFINGSRGVNELDGGAGNDRLLAFGDGDFLTGGTGGDTFDVRQVFGATRRGADTVTLTDFSYSDGDRIDAGPLASAQLDWIFGSSNDADGISQPAWIGTWDLASSGPFELIIFGAEDDPPTTDWFI